MPSASSPVTRVRQVGVDALGGVAGTDALKRLPRLATSAVRPLPDFLLVGAQKSGTTTLYDYIAQHRDVRAAMTKEVHYLDVNHARSLSWYRAHFPAFIGAGRSRDWLTGEASPYYLLHPRVPERAAAVVPDAKILVVLRHPVERAYSHFQHETAKGWEHLPFSDALDAEVERTDEAWEALSSGAVEVAPAVQHYSYVRRGRYAEQLNRWLKHYPRARLHVVIAEELFNAPEPVMRGVYRFLGCSDDSDLRFRRLNARSYSDLPDPIRERLNDVYRGSVEELDALLNRSSGWQL